MVAKKKTNKKFTTYISDDFIDKNDLSNKIELNNINDLSLIIHNNAVNKNFWDDDNIAVKLALCITELSEAIEADRCGNKKFSESSYFNSFKYMFNNDDKNSIDVLCDVLDNVDDATFKGLFEAHIKDTFEDELADTMIRILDIIGKFKIDIAFHINYKMKYNLLRPNDKYGKLY